MTVQGEADQRFVEVAREDNPILWALQQYQKVIRRWIVVLSAIEFTVLMQILDRTVGWRTTRRTISVRDLMDGGRVYRGIGHTVSRASIMNAVRHMEELGIIERHISNQHHRVKEYVVNLDWQEPPRRTEPDPEMWEEEDERNWVPSLYEVQQGSTS